MTKSMTNESVNFVSEPGSAPPGVPAVAAQPWLDEARQLARLAGPIVVTQLAQMCVGTTDVMMLGAYSKDALAASALGLSLFYGVWFLGMGPALAVSPMIAHKLGLGAGGRTQVQASVRMALWAVLALTPGLSACLFFTRDILLTLGEPADMAEAAGAFTRVLSAGLPFLLLFNVLRGFATALSRPMLPLVVMGLTIAFNAAADYGLIFGHFGLPQLGLIGSGIATASSFAFSFAAMLAIVLITPSLRCFHVFRHFHRLVWPELAEVLRLGIPMGVTMIFEVMFFNAGTLIMGHFGAAAVAAHQVALNAASLTFMVPLGIATAATVRVGLAAGARDAARARRAGVAAIGMGASFMSLSAVTLALFPRQIAGLYVGGAVADNADVIADAVVFLRFAAAFQLFDSFQVTASHALRGLKDASVPMWLAGGTYWLIGLPTALALAFWAGLGGKGVWAAFVLSLIVAAVAMTLRFARKSRRFS